MRQVHVFEPLTQRNTAASGDQRLPKIFDADSVRSHNADTGNYDFLGRVH
jgi:hypothetical protein